MKFLLADDHHIVRQGLQLLIEEMEENIQFLHASNLNQVLFLVRKEKIDFAILDAQFPDGNCLSKIKEIKEIQPAIKILIFTSFNEEIYAVRFINEGADGYLNKLSDESEILKAIQILIKEGKYFSKLTKSLFELSMINANILNPLNQLSDREYQIAKLLINGYGNLEISNQLSIKQNTVSTFKKRIFQKLNISNIFDLSKLIKNYEKL